MPELIDIEWFNQHTKSSKTKELVKTVLKWQEKALADNDMPLLDEILTLNLDGDDICVEASSAVNALEIYQEIFRDQDHQKVPGFSPEGKSVIIDLGANYGFYSLLVKRKAPECKVVSLEPNKYIYPLLTKNLEKFHNITLENAAIGTEDKIGVFELVRQIPSIGGLTLRQVNRKWLEESLIERIDVKYISLESIFKNHKIDYCDILKIDVEGLESEILNSAPDEIITRAKRIVVERHTPEIHKEVINRLTSIGFTLVYDQDPECERHYGNLYFEQQ